MAVDWELLEQQGIRRSGNKGVGAPSAFVIVGVDVEASELLAKFEGDEEAQAIIKKGAQDAARLRDPIPGWFVRNLETGKPKAIIVYQLIEDGPRGKRSWPIVLDGRTRTMIMRQHVAAGKQRGDASKERVMEAEIKTYSKERGAGIWALRQKARANHYVQESLWVKAERAFDFHEDGVNVVQIADEIGMDFGDPSTDDGRKSIEREVGRLLRWHEMYPLLCAEAIELAGRWKLPFGRAVRLSKMSKADQKARLEGQRVPRQQKPARPLSPRVASIFLSHVSAQFKKAPPADFMLGVRFALGDKSAAKDLPEGLRAAWLKTQEDAAKKPRKEKSA